MCPEHPREERPAVGTAGGFLDWDALDDETVRYLSALIQIDTSNPPGNERAAAEYLASQLDLPGIHLDLLEMAPSRTNIVARLQGDGSERPLLILSHLDVVPAAGPDWRYPPFAGVVDDGHVWGRGAVDMKHVVASTLAVLRHLADLKMPLTRDIIFAATANEESAEESGAAWLFRTRPDLVECELAVSEGGDAVVYQGRPYLLIECAERGWVTVELHRSSRPGHTSLPNEDNCLLDLGPVLSGLASRGFPHRVTTAVQAFFAGLAADLDVENRDLVDRLLRPESFGQAMGDLDADDRFRRRVVAALHSQVTATRLVGGESTWISPAAATLTLAGRVLPGENRATWLRELEDITGPIGEAQVSDFAPGIEIPHENDFFRVLADVASRHNSGTKVLPWMSVAGGDVRHAMASGALAYGFFPLIIDDDGTSTLDLAHVVNERISTENLARCSRYVWDLICLTNGLDHWLSPVQIDQKR